MKRLSKLLSLTLVLVMLLTCAATALAATITVNNALAGGEYKAYKIFDATEAEGGSSYAYTIESTSPWFQPVSSFANNGSDGLKLTQVGATTTYNVTVTDSFQEAEAAALAEALYTALGEIETKPDATAKGATASTDNNGGTTAVFNDLAAGYYLITSPLGSKCILNTAGTKQTIEEKNDLPTIEKFVDADDSTESIDWQKENDAAFGAIVNFKIEITVNEAAENYVVTDKLPTGLTLTESGVEVSYQKKDSTTSSDVAEGNYTLTQTRIGENTFQITFQDTYLRNLSAGDKLIITYSATLENTAEVGKALINTATLAYGKGQSKQAITNTYTWSFTVKKVSEQQTPLSGATFELYSDKECKTKIWLKKGEDGSTYQVSGDGTDSIAAGEVTIQGLDSGTYYLKETAAPSGYNKLSGVIEVVIAQADNNAETTNDGKVTYTYQKDDGTTVSVNEDDGGTVTVVNNKGTLLPSTGGAGTTLFYILGGILVVGAGVLLITKKRMSGEA